MQISIARNTYFTHKVIKLLYFSLKGVFELYYFSFQFSATQWLAGSVSPLSFKLNKLWLYQ